MKVKDLITELQRFNEDDNICVEVSIQEVAKTASDCDTTLFFDVDTVTPENTSRHSLKITLI